MAQPVIRGDTSIWRIPIVNTETLEPHNLSGCTVWVTVKSKPEDPDSEAIYQHTMTVGMDGSITHSDGMYLESDAASGVAVQELTPEESAVLTPGKYTYDVQVMTGDGRIFTPINGETEEIVGDITRAIERPS